MSAPAINDIADVTPAVLVAATEHSERRARALIDAGMDEDAAIAQAADEAILVARRAAQLARRASALVELVDAYDGSTYRLLRDLGDHLGLSLATSTAKPSRRTSSAPCPRRVGSRHRPVHRPGPRRARRRLRHLPHRLDRDGARQSRGPRLRLHRGRPPRWGRSRVSARLGTLSDVAWLTAGPTVSDSMPTRLWDGTTTRAPS